MYRKILIPTDGSRLADYAAHTAIQCAKAWGSELVVLSVAQLYPLVAAGEGMIMMPEGEINQLIDEARVRTDQVVEMARKEGINCTGITEVSAEPWEQIIRTAQEQHCDLVFMGSHGRRGISRLVAGSQTQQVLAHSHIPVLVLRPEPSALDASWEEKTHTHPRLHIADTLEPQPDKH
jgi:nucleotide-binding universal stress UspA family protein